MGLNDSIFIKFHNIDNFNDYFNAIICKALFYKRCEYYNIDLLKNYNIHNYLLWILFYIL